MKTVFYSLVFLCSAFVFSQTNFEKGMQKAFELWKTDKTDDAQNMFERITFAEPDEWLPHYYIAQINSLKSWNEKDPTILKARLEKAQEHLNTAMSISKNNPELMVLQANVWTNWVAYDGMTYGMKYSGKISELYREAAAVAPNNPRVIFGKAEWDMGSAKYFGKDTKPYCKDIEKSIALFDTFKPKSKFHPDWGKDRAVEALKNCEE